MPWQVQLSGHWVDLDPNDGERFSKNRDAGKLNFQIRAANGVVYVVDIATPGMTQVNKKTGRSRPIRYWEAEDDFDVSDATNDCSMLSHPAHRPILGPSGLNRVGSGVNPNRMQISVWLNGDWQPISANLTRQIRDALNAGETRFSVKEGPFSFTVDTTGKDGWLQIGRKRTRKMRVAELSAESIDRLPGSPVARIQQEWASIASGKMQMNIDHVIAAWQRGAEAEDPDLLTQTVADLFKKMDLSRNGIIEECEWMHYRLLELQAPSFHSLAEVNEIILERCKHDRTFPGKLLKCFLKNGGDAEEGRISNMTRAAREWLQESRTMAPKAMSDDNKKYIQELIEKDKEHEYLITYYNFVNHMLGRRKSKVQLYFYDLLNGRAWWMTPVLLGQYLEGIWHTGVVVHGREYWFGGNIFESTPGKTPFGTPTKIVTLPSETMRTKEDLWNFLSRECADEFTRENYDVLKHNCNHFSDRVSLFLLNEHIPDEVLKQPEMVMDSYAVKLLQPLLNRWLGTFGDESKGARRTDEVAAQGTWEKLTAGSLVVYEYAPGWTRIARMTSKAGETCTLEWIDTSTLKSGSKIGVSRVQVTALPMDKGRPRRSPVGGGIFASCHKGPGDVHYALGG